MCGGDGTVGWILDAIGEKHIYAHMQRFVMECTILFNNSIFVPIET